MIGVLVFNGLNIEEWSEWTIKINLNRGHAYELWLISRQLKVTLLGLKQLNDKSITVLWKSVRKSIDESMQLD